MKKRAKKTKATKARRPRKTSTRRSTGRGSKTLAEATATPPTMLLQRPALAPILPKEPVTVPNFVIPTLEGDRWIAKVPLLAIEGYGTTRDEAIQRATSIAKDVVAARVANGEAIPDEVRHLVTPNVPPSAA